MVNRSNGMLRLNASITQSRHFHMSRWLIDVIAVRVGIAGEVEPLHRHALAVLRRGEQAVHLLFVGVGGFVGEEGFDFAGRGRQAGEVEGQAAEQRGPVGFGRGLQPLASRRARTKRSIGFLIQAAFFDGGEVGAFRSGESPVGFPFRAFVDPLSDELRPACR